MIANESVRNENAVVFLDRPTTHRSGVPARRAPRSRAIRAVARRELRDTVTHSNGALHKK